MAYTLSNICTENTGTGQLLLKLALAVGWYFLRHSEYAADMDTDESGCSMVEGF